MDSGIVTDDRFILEIVAEHLRSLQYDWTPFTDDAPLARMSNVLRVLLVGSNNGGAYSHSWRLAGFRKQPTVVAADLLMWFGDTDPTHLQFAQAGGAEYSPIYARDHPILEARTGIGSHIVVVNKEYAEEIGKARTTAITQNLESEFGPYMRRYWLSEYLASPSFIFRGQYLSRRTVIKYAANKLGGAHLDTKRDAKEHEMLDLINVSYGTLGKPAVYFELLSIGQAIARSEDAQTLRAYVNALPPRPSH